MLTGIKLHNFKNHLDSSFDFNELNLIIWPNGSGKTNILEAIYFLVNAHPYQSQKVEKMKNFLWDNFIINWIISTEVWIDKDIKITYDWSLWKLSYLYSLSRLSKAKYLEVSKYIWVFLSPQEMNIMYLGPSWRRDFLDEVCFLYDKNFHKIKNDYSKILKNRNKILKNIKEWLSLKIELKYRDEIFIKTASIYYRHRLLFINYIKNNINQIEELLGKRYTIYFEYLTKVDLTNIENSIKNYLDKNIDRDIMLGHTYIWPHLDDFVFKIKKWDEFYNSFEFLSRWENKSILIWLKFLQIEFYSEKNSEKILLLLDDIFSELDDEHIRAVLEYSKNFETFITAQNLPNFLQNEANINLIYIY